MFVMLLQIQSSQISAQSDILISLIRINMYSKQSLKQWIMKNEHAAS